MSLSRMVDQRTGSLWLKLFRDEENGGTLLAVEKHTADRMTRSPLLTEWEVRRLYAFVGRHCPQMVTPEPVVRYFERRRYDAVLARDEIQRAIHQVRDGDDSPGVRVLPNLPPHWYAASRWPHFADP